MRVGTSYKQHRGLARRWDAIVIGSGIGGLAAAAAMARVAGKRVLVLERHYTAGGFTHTFRRPGYEWDVGVHYIGEVNRERGTLRRVFDFVTAGALEWADMGAVYDRILVDGRPYDLVAGRAAFRERMCGYFPSEARAIDRYLDLLSRTVRRSQWFFAEKAVPEGVSSLFGGLMRRGTLAAARRTTRDVLEALTSNQELIGVLTGQWGDYGLPPAQSSFLMHAMVAHHYLRGAAYPVGGASRMAETILPVIEASGGEVITNAEVDQILTARGRAVGVRLADGTELRAPVVVSDAGVVNTFGRLLPDGLASPAGASPGVEGLASSVGHLSLYVGLRAPAAALGLEKTNVWVYPSPHHEQNVARFLDDPSAALPVAYLSFPSAKDPDFERRYPGRATIEVITLAPYAWFSAWEGTAWKKRGDDYDALKAQLAQRLLDVLYAQCPSTRGEVDVFELSTPLSTRNFANHPSGEIYGLAHTPRRFEQRWLRPRTPLPGLYLTGADVASAGVAGALMGGILCATAVVGPKVIKAAYAGHPS
ncbi:MAG: NAD(P)/FAD-dependent oxidoreductase [Myxococcales bacterium]|nr:NAD(P)/FAD-dependent oxidoreductase [Myxococcales bacterium]